MATYSRLQTGVQRGPIESLRERIDGWDCRDRRTAQNSPLPWATRAAMYLHQLTAAPHGWIAQARALPTTRRQYRTTAVRLLRQMATYKCRPTGVLVGPPRPNTRHITRGLR